MNLPQLQSRKPLLQHGKRLRGCLLSLSIAICDFWHSTFVIPPTAHPNPQGLGDAGAAACHLRSQRARRAGTSHHPSSRALHAENERFLLWRNLVPIFLRWAPRAPNTPQTSAWRGRADPHPDPTRRDATRGPPPPPPDRSRQPRTGRAVPAPGRAHRSPRATPAPSGTRRRPARRPHLQRRPTRPGPALRRAMTPFAPVTSSHRDSPAAAPAPRTASAAASAPAGAGGGTALPRPRAASPQLRRLRARSHAPRGTPAAAGAAQDGPRRPRQGRLVAAAVLGPDSCELPYRHCTESGNRCGWKGPFKAVQSTLPCHAQGHPRFHRLSPGITGEGDRDTKIVSRRGGDGAGDAALFSLLIISSVRSSPSLVKAIWQLCFIAPHFGLLCAKFPHGLQTKMSLCSAVCSVYFQKTSNSGH